MKPYALKCTRCGHVYEYDRLLEKTAIELNQRGRRSRKKCAKSRCKEKGSPQWVEISEAGYGIGVGEGKTVYVRKCSVCLFVGEKTYSERSVLSNSGKEAVCPNCHMRNVPEYIPKE